LISVLRFSLFFPGLLPRKFRWMALNSSILGVFCFYNYYGNTEMGYFSKVNARVFLASWLFVGRKALFGSCACPSPPRWGGCLGLLCRWKWLGLPFVFLSLHTPIVYLLSLCPCCKTQAFDYGVLSSVMSWLDCQSDLMLLATSEAYHAIVTTVLCNLIVWKTWCSSD
jgi:hypothetical protein